MVLKVLVQSSTSFFVGVEGDLEDPVTYSSK